jgi:isoquinoline 1-oxidoreductase beta subunit
MTTPPATSRRQFLITSVSAGGALLLGVRLPQSRELFAAESAAELGAAAEGFEPHVLIRLESSGATTILVTRTEMGQGVWTALPMIVAEEMDADWKRVKVERAPVQPKYGETGTGGSDSVRGSWEPLRAAGATARAMLLTAAAQTWSVPESECSTHAGEVLHRPSGRKLGYGALAAKASTLAVPDAKSLQFKSPADYRIIGKSTRRADTPMKVNGRAKFGIDVQVPGMLVASVARCPVMRGAVARVNDAKARAVPGVRQVIQLDPVEEGRTLPARVAVIADNTWAAMQGRKALEIEWEEGRWKDFSTASLSAQCMSALETPGVVAHQSGDANAARTGAAKVVSAVFEVPYLAHAPMEPMNCTAHVHDGVCEVWAPTQFPTSIVRAASKELGIAPEAVTVHVTFAGGGFGRRAYSDFALEAVQLSKRVGAPVKVIWSREEDIRHDLFRPARVERLRAALDGSGKILSWETRLLGASIQRFWNPNAADPQRRDWGGSLPMYPVANTLIDFVAVDSPVPVGAWRAVSNGENCFCIESFMDELAHAAGVDPLEYHLRMIGDVPRMAHVLRLVGEKSGWGTPLPRGRGRGIAAYDYDGTLVAEVAEVTVGADDVVKLDRVVCALDCGQVINPDTVRAQVEGSVAWAAGATLYGEITVEKGRVQQSNFHDYRVLRMPEMPKVEVHLVESHEPPSGVGEPAVPPLAPALGNAVFAATGMRVRKLPIRLKEARVSLR